MEGGVGSRIEAPSGSAAASPSGAAAAKRRSLRHETRPKQGGHLRDRIGRVEQDYPELVAADARRRHVAASRRIREPRLQPRYPGLGQSRQTVLQEVMIVVEVEVLALDWEGRLSVAGLRDPRDPRIRQIGARELRQIERTGVVVTIAEAVRRRVVRALEAHRLRLEVHLLDEPRHRAAVVLGEADSPRHLPRS